jgi:ElaB/YqjD/DUF883 family membrane-anchored ribosome-binding protein
MLEDAGRRASEAAFEKSQEYYEGSRDMAMSFAHGVENYVREQPIRAILITVGLVCLVTSCFVRR